LKTEENTRINNMGQLEIAKRKISHRDHEHTIAAVPSLDICGEKLTLTV